MSRTATTLIIGLTVGALTVVLYRRFREVVQENDPEAILDRLSTQIQELELRLNPDKIV